MSNRYLHSIRSDYKGDMDKKRDFKKIKKFFSIHKKDEYTLDNQTWDDLDMNKVYEKLDRAYSSPGEAALYTMLRNPLMKEEKLKKRGKLIQSFKENDRLRESLQCIFLELGSDIKNSFLDMIETDLIINKTKYYIYTFIGKILPLIAILLAIFVNIKFMIVLFGIASINMLINSSEVRQIKSNGIFYLQKNIKAAKKIVSINNKDIVYYKDKITIMLKSVKDIDRNIRLIGFINMWQGLFEFISVIFLLEETAYYSISHRIKEEKEVLMDLYGAVGEVEALISIAGYKHNLGEQYVKPKFIKQVKLTIKEGIHPLIDKAVANSINIENGGIVLTGTNMAGKSTFLRMLGVNIILAQCFNFVLAKSYEAPFFNIVTSISPNDDLTKGKSFYMAEAEAILRIIKALEKDAAVFCPIDEIFRGTNPIERISMSAEILTYINNGKSVSIVATHDRELVNILKENYEFYYFSEKVDTSKGLSFDYKIKKGVSQTRNAIKLLEYMGYPKKIISRSFKRAETIEKLL
ncbi:DNA mismatch repair protein MutS [Clostridium sp. CM028]|uniref:MutS-related protein n=1 Tax=Clostridium sp. CM028 TaxID=2851575 RepID=UPI001C6DD9AB|nr:DNA mismatch repair protein MutS [Clostridium sp. CM028]MBW9147848.1 DNA mismatch repair protein MutS [Clostridium sp. CM028]WLC61288.1 DNA mismatch repair protein MutS [Clostridium sp. CM028]